MNGRRMVMLVVLAICLVARMVQARNALEENFSSPPASARPWVYWFPMSGNLTKEGITADLEAMARVGIGGVLYMEVNHGVVKGTADFAGPLWMEMLKHACSEANRLGLEINMNNDAGWTGSGGPWITPDLSMQKVVWSETFVEGGRNFEGTLPQPHAVQNFYRDIAVLAFPTIADDDTTMANLKPKFSCSGKSSKPGEFELEQPEKNQPQFVQIEFTEPFTLRMLTARFGGIQNAQGHIQSSDDGQDFKQVKPFSVRTRNLDLAMEFEQPVNARFFRIVVTKIDNESKLCNINNIDLIRRFRIQNMQGKASFTPTPRQMPPAPADWTTIPDGFIVSRDCIADLSSNMDSSGKLSWDVPAGKWTVLRFGHTTTGMKNYPAPQPGCGLECDKLSRKAAEKMFNGLMGRLIAENKALAGQGGVLVSTHIDSWEVGSQNWTPDMRNEFKRRRGYDLWKYLPVFTGRVVDSLEASERFLWDLRQTVSDLLVENYAGEFRRLANKHGLRLSIEAYGEPADNMAYAGQADEPMAEFWSWGKFGAAGTCTEMASAAHTYGKRILGAEAFTATDGEKWQGHPANIKDVGDWAFCEGINRFVFHRYAAQPWVNPDHAPGMSMGPWGLHYERTQTWWEQSKAWHEYLARCQYLLQQGLFVADVVYLQAEGAPRSFVTPAGTEIAPHVRGGYNFDGCTPEVVVKRMSVKNGRILLPDGMSYRLLVLPTVETMTPALLRKIGRLADQGATIIGGVRPPRKSPSLADMGSGDENVRKMAEKLWASGKIITNKVAAEALTELGVKPDFAAKPILRYIHRATEDTDIYFVANPEPHNAEAVASFRVTGRKPEFWWPDNGRMSAALSYEEKDGVTTMPLKLEPSGSVFVIFRKKISENNNVVSIKRNGMELLLKHSEPDTAPPAVSNSTIAGTTAIDIAIGEIRQSGNYILQTADNRKLELNVKLPDLRELAGPWDVQFDPKWGGPSQPVKFEKLDDWRQRTEDGIKYYSGTAVYRRSFEYSATTGIKDSKLYLDLGKVAVIAEVKLNGRELGILWKPPFRVDITGAVRQGENTLEVKVVNLWINRQIGDEQMPEDSERNADGTLKSWPQWIKEGKPSPAGRFTFTSWRLWKKDDALVESGLLGPVILQAAWPIEVK